MYKLVAIDLDGTLLNSYGEVSEKNKEAIQKAKNKGAEIVIASGRPISSARSYAYEVGADNYIICGNGSVLYDMKNEQIIYDKFIERQKALQIIKICEENSIFFNIYTEKLTISKSLNYNVLFYKRFPIKVNVFSGCVEHAFSNGFVLHSVIIGGKTEYRVIPVH